MQLKLHDWNVDFAVWCSYKYLNGGPGCIAGCFVHERHARNPGAAAICRMVGKRQDQRAFAWSQKFQAIAGAEGWQLSNPSILSMAALRASMDIFDEVGMERFREKSVTLTGYLEFLLAQQPAGSYSDHHSPRSLATGRTTLAADTEGGRAICEHLRTAGNPLRLA